MSTKYTNLIIGEKIKNLRNKNGLTQQELADRTELTKGYISQLEHGLAIPSVTTLLDIIQCLGSNAADFFSETIEEKIVFDEEDYFIKTDEKGNETQWLVPTAQKNRMEPVRIVLQPGEKTLADKPHEGEEFGYVLSGTVRLFLGNEVYTVRKGNSFYFSCEKKHYLAAVGKTRAVVLWISAPPSF